MELVLLHEINAGTFARLYLAETRGAGGIDRIVAVKILREQWNEQQDIVNRTRDEARLLARLRHKNILRVEDLVEVDGQTAIIMEYVDGLDLKQLVDGLQERRQRVPAKVALQIVLQAVSAIEAAYFKIPTGLEQPLKVVHRDVKPSNIMLSAEGEVRVLDFGTARSSHIFRSAQTGAMRFGSLKYMSPERREGDRGEHAGDIYALGLVLLELLRTEWLPLLPMDAGEHDNAIAQAIARLDSLGMPNADWDMTLRQMLAQMLASEPSVRPDAEQVVKLIRAFVEQASGPMLDRFAHESVAPLTAALHAQQTGGALAGRRLVVHSIANESRGSGPRPTPTRTGERGPAPAAAPGAFPPPRSPQPFQPPQAGPPAQPRAERAPVPVRAAAPAAEAEEEGGGGTALALGAAGLIVVIVLGVVLIGGAIGLWYAFGRGSGTSDPVAPPEPVVVAPPPVPDPPPPSATGVPVSVALEGEPAQWVRLETAGTTVVEGKGSLDATAPPGEYDLAIKIVGRSIVRSPLTLPTEGLSLSCTSDAKQNVRCTGGKRALTLRP